MAPRTKPFRLASLTWPVTARQWQSLSDMIEDVYQRLKEGVVGLGNLVLTALETGFSITGGTTTEATLTVTADASLSGTNTGDQTIALTGDVTGSGTGSFPTTLATVNANVGSFGSATEIPIFTVDAKGLITAASEVTVVAGQSSAQILARIWMRN